MNKLSTTQGSIPQPITRQQLEDLIANPHVSKEHITQYFLGNPDSAKATAPGLRLNPAYIVEEPGQLVAEGDTFLNWLNYFWLIRRSARFHERLSSGDTSPVVVSVGDSWFLFPIQLHDVTDNLSDDFNILSYARAGETLAEMAANTDYIEGLQEQSGRAKAFLLSGGGNDIIGRSTAPDGTEKSIIVEIVREFVPGRTVDQYLNTDAFRDHLAAIQVHCETILRTVRGIRSDLPILCHGYDYAIPWHQGDKRSPWWVANDKWLGSAFTELNIHDFSIQCQIVRGMIDRFNEMLKALGSTIAGVRHIDVRKTLGAARWADEVHPDDDGFRQVSALFRQTLKAVI